MINLRPATLADLKLLQHWDRQPHVISAKNTPKDTAMPLNLRPAALADLELLQHWDQQPHVIASDPSSDWNWALELAQEPAWREQWVAELDGRPLGFIQIIDPAQEESHYWGEVAANLRAIDIWIGEAADLGKGYGTTMMQLALEHCFADPSVTEVLIDPLASNTRAHCSINGLASSLWNPADLGMTTALCTASIEPIGIIKRPGTPSRSATLTTPEVTTEQGKLMQATANFADITAETPILSDVTSDYQRIQAQLAQAQTSEQRQAALQQWDALRRRLSTWRELTQLHFHQDTQNPEYKTALDNCDQLSPALTALEVELKRELIHSPDRAELEKILGPQAFRLWEADITTFDPAIAADLVEESKLTNEYTELIASAKLDFQGQSVNLSGLQPHLQSKDRSLRHQAEQCRWQFFEQHGDRFDQLFDQLVRLRDRMAKKLGFENYIALGYRRMQRVDYDQTDVERYRDQVVQEVVPLAIELLEQQARRLKLDTLYVWDESVFDAEGNPAPLGDHDWMLEQAQAMFDAMTPELGRFFAMMVDRHLLDLQNRPGKAGGGFCTAFPTYDVPFVFANFNGTKNDVQVFTHEMGHAFQMWRSRNLPVFDYLWPTLESCEIHSMSLELLTSAQMEKFFGDQADRFRRQHLGGSILFLPYGVAVDHFQHLVYANPEATPQERHQMWQQMEARYLPWRRYGDLNYPNRGGLWQDKQHIYCSPFYYIDYTLAGCCALQFWVKAEADYSQALAEYIALCDRGGSASFQQLVQSANLVSPFEPGALTPVVAKVRQALISNSKFEQS